MLSILYIGYIVLDILIFNRSNTIVINIICMGYCYFKIIFVGLGSDDEVKLVKHLFESQGYNPLIRPVKNLTDHVEVDFGLALIQLISVVSRTMLFYIN